MYAKEVINLKHNNMAPMAQRQTRFCFVGNEEEEEESSDNIYNVRILY
jgi:hypothetical protein